MKTLIEFQTELRRAKIALEGYAIVDGLSQTVVFYSDMFQLRRAQRYFLRQLLADGFTIKYKREFRN